MATYGANTNIDNERKYLNDLMNLGGGKAEWAQNQMKELDSFASQTPTQTPAQLNPSETIYYSPEGEKQFGYNFGGKTYKDQSGTQRIDEGSYVQTGDKWWQMGAQGGQQVDIPDFAKTLGNYGSYQNMLQDIPYPMGKNENVKDIQGQIGDVISALQSYEPTKSMGRDESQARAYSQLNSLYNQNLDKQLDNYNRDAVSRGMFGQLPVEAMKQSAISESEVNKASAIGDLAGNLFTQDFNMARQTDADTLNRQNALLGALGQNYGIERDMSADQRADFMNLSNLATQEISQQYQNAFTKLNTLGYADEEVANALGVPVGTPSEQINLINIQDKMQRELLEYQNQLSMQSAAYKASLGGGSGNASDNPNITIPQRLDIWEQAIELATKQESTTDLSGNVTYQTIPPSYDEAYAMYLQLIGGLGYDPYQLHEDDFINQLLQDSENNIYKIYGRDERNR